LHAINIIVLLDTLILLHTSNYIKLYATSQGRCDEELNKVVDQNNMCWYHECVNNNGYLEFLPRRCAGGSKISYNFVQGPENPCTVNFDSGK